VVRGDIGDLRPPREIAFRSIDGVVRGIAWIGLPIRPEQSLTKCMTEGTMSLRRSRKGGSCRGNTFGQYHIKDPRNTEITVPGRLTFGVRYQCPNLGTNLRVRVRPRNTLRDRPGLAFIFDRIPQRSAH
jgi:hypothetical protein